MVNFDVIRKVVGLFLLLYGIVGTAISLIQWISNSFQESELSNVIINTIILLLGFALSGIGNLISNLFPSN